MVGRGDEERFERIVLPYLNAGYNLARWLTRNEHDAEDVVQEASLRALRSFKSFLPGRDARAWFLTIVRNTCWTWLRQNRPKELALEWNDETLPAPGNADPQALLIEKANTKLIHEAIESLPVEYREVLILRELEELSYKEIADIAGIPLGTVMSRLSRARKELYAVLGHEVGEVKR